MIMNHAAIYRAYPQVVAIYDDRGAFDAAGNQVQLDPAKVEAAAIIVDKEQIIDKIRRERAAAYKVESDPIFFKAQRGEETMDDWRTAVAAIQLAYPYPDEEQTI